METRIWWAPFRESEISILRENVDACTSAAAAAAAAAAPAAEAVAAEEEENKDDVHSVRSPNMKTMGGAIGLTSQSLWGKKKPLDVYKCVPNWQR